MIVTVTVALIMLDRQSLDILHTDLVIFND